MSVYSAKTGLSSILKSYTPTEREKTKAAIINKVRFQEPRRLKDGINGVLEKNNYMIINEYGEYLKECTLNESDFIRAIKEAHSLLHLLDPRFGGIIEILLTLPWANRSPQAIQAYQDFFVDLLVAQVKHLTFAINNLIRLWIPKEEEKWVNGTPAEDVKYELQAVHKLIARILSIIPIACDVVIEKIYVHFPYYKKLPFIVGGFVHNVLWFLEYQPNLNKDVMKVLIRKLLIFDVNAPRHEIEESEMEDENEDEMYEEEEDNDEEMFKMEDTTITTTTTTTGEPKITAEILPMNHQVAHALDLSMEKTMAFIDRFNPNVGDGVEEKSATLLHALEFLEALESIFEKFILPGHNTHHVQFLVFYFCSFKNVIGEKFLEFLWSKINDPNESAVARQTAVGYIASFLARSKNLSLAVLKNYLKELCEWAHQYIHRSDQYRSNGSLKANLVFFSVCQAIFYVIAFRSRDLTADKKDLLFLQSLQLSALVTCNFNPLRVCLPAVATAFAGVTRAYQLAYCHAILERNARRKLATVYANEKATPEETLDTFFPFDPYLLKISSRRIHPIYLQYQPNEAEEESSNETTNCNADRLRKRGDSEMIDDIDDFLIADKRQKLSELARSQEAQFTYGLSPGFHT